MNWTRRLKLWWYGECRIEGCHEPCASAYLLSDYCWPHYQQRLKESAKEAAQQEFDREANVIAEGIRRARQAR